jgi:Caspase domain/WD domain, G-beta repeat/Bacterial Ig domain
VIRTIENTDWVWSVAFSPDGNRLLSGGTDKALKLWDAATGRLVRTFKGHAGQTKSVAFLRNGHRIVSGSDDGTMRVWDAETGAQLVVLSMQGEGKWLALTPAGFFAGSRLGNDFLGIVRGLDVTTIDQVHQSLFNPDLVREVLAGDPSREVQEAAKIMSLEKVVDSGPAPVVSIASPVEGIQSTSDLATITARIEDRGKGVGRVEWRVNGVTAAVVAKPPGDGPAYTLSQQLALDLGDNLLASLLARTTIKFTGSPDRAKPKLHILAIGVDAYIEQPLSLAVKDAKAFAASMRKAAGDLYEEVRVTFALDRVATRDNLEKVVDAVAAQIHPRDTFILFAAGHGLSENGRFYFIPQDYQSGLGDLAQTAVGQDRLQDWLANRIKARRAIILLDTCESGALVAGHARSRADAPASEAAVGRLHEATGRPVLTAAAAGQFAHEGLIGASGERHGVFTWAVLDALRKGDSNGNGIIELSELVRYVQSVVPKIAANMGGAGRAATSEPIWGQQAARFGSRGEDFALAQRLQ